MTGKQLDENIRQVGFLLLLLSMLILFVRELNFFTSSILGSFTLYLLLRSSYFKLIEKKGWNQYLANLFLIMMTILVLLCFGGAIFGTGFMKLKDFSPQIVMDTANRLHDLILDKTGYNLFSKDLSDKMITWMSSLLPNIFNLTNSVFSNFIMMIFILFFLFKGGRNMEAKIENFIPLSSKTTTLLKTETRNIVISNTIGIPLIMLLQAMFSFLGYWLFGVSNPVIWAVLTGLFGIVPILGTSIIWFPLSVFLMLNGHIWMGVGLVAYSLIIITNVDNVFRIFFLDKFAQIHPLITVFGIILGLNLFGFWGIIFGPLLISAFFILLKVYKYEFLEKGK